MDGVHRIRQGLVEVSLRTCRRFLLTTSPSLNLKLIGLCSVIIIQTIDGKLKMRASSDWSQRFYVEKYAFANRATAGESRKPTHKCVAIHKQMQCDRQTNKS